MKKLLLLTLMTFSIQANAIELKIENTTALDPVIVHITFLDENKNVLKVFEPFEGYQKQFNEFELGFGDNEDPFLMSWKVSDQSGRVLCEESILPLWRTKKTHIKVFDMPNQNWFACLIGKK